MLDNKDYLEQNNLAQVSREFLSHAVTRTVSTHVIERASRNGTLDELNTHLKRQLDQDLLRPTLRGLANRKLTGAIDITDLEEDPVLDSIFQGLVDLTHDVSSRYSGDIIKFIYASNQAGMKILSSRRVFASGAYNHVERKLCGVYFDTWGQIPDYDIIIGAIPKSLIDKEEYVPYFIQEIINHQ